MQHRTLPRVAALLVLCLTPPTARAAEPADAAAGKRALDFMLIDATSGGPVKTALRVRADSTTWQAATDADGRCRVEYPAGAKYLSILAGDDPAYVPTRVQFYNELGSEPPPASYALLIERGTVIGGTVVDEAGRPIGGATVHLDLHAKRSEPRPREEVFLFGITVPTDGQGRWLFARAPREFQANVRLSHPDFVSDVSPRVEDAPPADKLRARAAVLVMKKGITVAGRVVDKATGRPLANAEVAQGGDRWGNDYPVARTGADGRFRFGGGRPGPMVLTVTAAGHAPDLRDLNVAEGMAELEVALEPGRVLRGRVVDTAGKPVAGATVGSDTWRKRRTLMWRTGTDSEGRFTWNEAPPDEVLGYVGADGFAMLRDLPLVAAGPEKEVTFTLLRPLKVTGSVTDAETGAPVEQFTVVRGTVARGGGRGEERVSWDREQTQAAGRGGTFEFVETESRGTHAVRVEAPGYAAAESRPFKVDRETLALEFRLEKSKGLAGVLRLPDGTPAVGAKLGVATGPGTYVNDGALRREMALAAGDAFADDFGRFRLPEQSGKFVLVAVHDAGYAHVAGEALKPEKDGTVTLTLTPWASVHGTALVGAKPAAGQHLSLEPDWTKRTPASDAEPSVEFRGHTTAGDDGRFAFERVAVGRVSVGKVVSLGEGMSTTSHREWVDVKPGQRAEVQVGGRGRPVVGRVTFAPAVAARPWAVETSVIETIIVDPPMPRKPAGFDAMSEAEQRAWAMETGGARAAEIERGRLAYRSYPLVVDRADGAFRVDDLPAGRYRLRVSVAATGTPQHALLGDLRHAFTVPPMPGGRSDEPLDLGVLTVGIPQHPTAR